MLNCCCTNCCCENFIYISLLIVCIVFAFVAIYDVYKSFSAKVLMMTFPVFLSVALLSLCYTCWFYDDFIAIATFLITAIGIIIAAQTLDGTKKATEAQVINQYNERYFQENICKSLKMLWNYHDIKENLPLFSGQRTDINNFGKRIKPNDVSKLKEELNKENSDLDKARRTIKGYFLNAHAMLEQKFISKEAFRQIVDKEAISAFFIIIEVMEYAKREKGDYDYKPFWQIMNDFPDLYAKYKDSKF